MQNNDEKNIQEQQVAKENLIMDYVPAELKTKKLRVKLIEVPTSHLNINHPFYNLIDINPNEYYSKIFKELLPVYNPPFIARFDNEYYVLGNREEVWAANNNGIDKMKAFLVEGLEKDDVPRFINFKTFYTHKGYTNLYDFIKFLEKHLRK